MAWGRGDVVVRSDGTAVGSGISAGRFLVTDTIQITRQDGVSITDSFFDYRPNRLSKSALFVPPA